MAGLMTGNSVNRGVRKAAPGMRRNDETMFAPREDETGFGGGGPKGPHGQGFGVRSFRDDMEVTGGPDTAPMPNPGEDQSPGEEGDQPNVSPEEQAQYTKFVDNGLKLIFDRNTAPKMLQRIKASGDPTEGLASTTVLVVTKLKDSAANKGMKLSDDVLMHGGIELMENLAELSKAAGVHEFTPDEIETAMYRAADQYGTREIERGTIDKETLAKNFQMMMEADKAGRIDDVIPGLSQRAQEIMARRGAERGQGQEPTARGQGAPDQEEA